MRGWLKAVLLVLAAAALETGGRAQAATLTLDEAVHLALTQSPLSRGAYADREAARAAADKAAAEAGFQVGLTSRWSYLSDVPTVQAVPGRPGISLGEKDAWVTAATGSYVLWSGGRLGALVAAASDGARATDELSRRTRNGVAAAAERTFRLLAAAESLESVAVASVAAAAENLGAARSRFDARAVARFDVLRAEVQEAEAEQELVRARGARRMAHAALLQVMGLAGGEFTTVPPSTETTVAGDLEGVLARARLQRPELAAAGWQEKAAAEALAAARGERWPVVAAAADYQYAEPESVMQYSRWSAGVSLTFPLWDGGRTSAGIRQAAGRLEGARAATLAVLRGVENEVRQAWERAESTGTEMKVAARRAEQAGELLRLARVRYDGGVGTAVEVADAQATEIRARQGVIQAATDRALALLELRLASGDIAGEPGVGEGEGR